MRPEFASLIRGVTEMKEHMKSNETLQSKLLQERKRLGYTILDLTREQIAVVIHHLSNQPWNGRRDAFFASIEDYGKTFWVYCEEDYHAEGVFAGKKFDFTLPFNPYDFQFKPVEWTEEEFGEAYAEYARALSTYELLRDDVAKVLRQCLQFSQNGRALEDIDVYWQNNGIYIETETKSSRGFTDYQEFEMGLSVLQNPLDYANRHIEKLLVEMDQRRKAHNQSTEESNKKARQHRHEQYLKLKKEFESSDQT